MRFLVSSVERYSRMVVIEANSEKEAIECAEAGVAEEVEFKFIDYALEPEAEIIE